MNNQNGSLSTLTNTQRMVSAMFGSALTAFAVTPLDVVKTRLQSQISPQNCCQSIMVWNGMIECLCYTSPQHGPSQKFSGTWDGISKIIRYEGPLNLWRGLSATLVTAIPTTVIYFVGYEHLRDYLRQSLPKSRFNDYEPILAGSLARTMAVVTVSPLELIRTRIQSQNGKQSGMKKVLKGVVGMVQEKGILHLWRGLGSTLWRDVPFSGMYWMGYETLRPKVTKKLLQNDIQPTEFLVAFTSGATSGAIAAVLTTPFDVAKTRRQVEIGHLSNANISTLKTLKMIFKQEGVAGLTRGITARILKTAPACAIMITSYELGKMYFNSINGDIKSVVNIIDDIQ